MAPARESSSVELNTACILARMDSDLGVNTPRTIQPNRVRDAIGSSSLPVRVSSAVMRWA